MTEKDTIKSNVTNISEFERTKPRKTYQALEDVIKYVETAVNQHVTYIYSDVILEKLLKVKGHFLKGE